jgi:hypothetical protein
VSGYGTFKLGVAAPTASKSAAKRLRRLRVALYRRVEAGGLTRRGLI